MTVHACKVRRFPNKWKMKRENSLKGVGGRSWSSINEFCMGTCTQIFDEDKRKLVKFLEV